MPPRGKKAYKKNFSSSFNRRQNANEKENINSEISGNPIKLQSEETKSKNSKESVLLQPSRKQEVKQKTVGFWSKKLQDLELEEGANSKEKWSLYEFSGSEESKSYQKIKKAKQRSKVARRKKAALSKCNKPLKCLNKLPQLLMKEKQFHRQSLFREQLILSRERENLAEKDKKFTFSTEMQSIGITSTPAVNKDNLIDASNFLFLSPIVSSNEAKCCSSVFPCTPLRSKKAECPNILPFGQEPLKADTELKKFDSRRILRSGKILNI